MSAEFAKPAADKLTQTQNEVNTLLARVLRVKEGFELLPLESEFADLLDEEDQSDVEAAPQ